MKRWLVLCVSGLVGALAGFVTAVVIGDLVYHAFGITELSRALVLSLPCLGAAAAVWAVLRRKRRA